MFSNSVQLTSRGGPSEDHKGINTSIHRERQPLLPVDVRDLSLDPSTSHDEHKGSQLSSAGDVDVDDRGLHASTFSSTAAAGISYIVTSSTLILLNKYALSGFRFKCPNSLLLAHCVLAVIMCKLAQLFQLIKLEPLRWNIIKTWIPVNLIFVGMIATSFLSLQHIGIGMFTLLKNLSNFITITGDWYFFNKTYNSQVWLSLGLMVASASIGAYTDSKFDAHGYAWQLINCFLTSAYSLYLSGTMERVVQYTRTKERMSEFSMVYYNNLLSIGPILLLMWTFGEFKTLPDQKALWELQFQLVALLGGILGFGISFTSLWYVSRSSATVFSLTGSLNKIIVAVAGILLFREPSSLANLFSIAVGLSAGIIFVLAKTK